MEWRIETWTFTKRETRKRTRTSLRRKRAEEGKQIRVKQGYNTGNLATNTSEYENKSEKNM
jgi:hypothetical protein